MATITVLLSLLTAAYADQAADDLLRLKMIQCGKHYDNSTASGYAEGFEECADLRQRWDAMAKQRETQRLQYEAKRFKEMGR
jgi:flagellar biosynthesis/type III secretory pathway protein FliH